MRSFTLPPRRYRVDPLAFFVALIGAPLLVTALTFWAYLIPVFALIFGAVPYLLLGTPALLVFLPRYGSGALKIALLAFCVMGAALAVVALLFAAFPANQDLQFILQLGSFGLIFAPLWGAAFGWIYGPMAEARSS